MEPRLAIKLGWSTENLFKIYFNMEPRFKLPLESVLNQCALGFLLLNGSG